MFPVFTKVLLITLCFYRCSAENSTRKYESHYHIDPPYGWMNDPNGFSYFKGIYHLFYQYNPYSSQEAGIAHWGHATSPDLVNWTHEPIALYPDKSYDKTGVFSGSALIENDTMYLFYTGNVNHPDETPDHEQHQALVWSTDGFNFTKYPNNPIINGDEHQPNFRDPKVWKHDGTYYMVLGNSFNNDTLGRVLLYASKDMITWEQKSILIESQGFLGYMCECPDFFKLGDKFVLLMSPQGIKPQDDNYRNLYQVAYYVGYFDYANSDYLFTPITTLRELDHGHDFYATQTLLDDAGRRIVIAWCDMWEQNYPERNDNSTGRMTIPRELSLTSDLRLIQTPIKELASARGQKLFSGEASCNDSIKLTNKAAEIKVTAEGLKNIELIIESENQTISISYDYLKGKVTLDRGDEDGIRRTNWRPSIGSKLLWYIYIDTSTIELFCGDGTVTFSSRYFPTGDVSIRLGNNSVAEELLVYEMKTTISTPNQ